MNLSRIKYCQFCGLCKKKCLRVEILCRHNKIRFYNTTKNLSTMEISKILYLRPPSVLFFRLNCHFTILVIFCWSLAGRYFLNEQEQKTGQEKLIFFNIEQETSQKRNKKVEEKSEEIFFLYLYF